MRIATSLLLAAAALIDPARIVLDTPQPVDLEWTPFTFTTDAGESTDAERAVMTVPERHANPSGASIKLPLIRFKSKATKPGAPIFFLAGGPGNSGLSNAKRDQFFPGAMALREVSDVIFFDQRGTGAADPSLIVDVRLGVAPDEPIGSEKARLMAKAAAESVAKIIKSRGIDLAAYNTRESADDIESIRVALGADKISLWGHSYGSHLGLAYIKYHGEQQEPRSQCEERFLARVS